MAIAAFWLSVGLVAVVILVSWSSHKDAETQVKGSLRKRLPGMRTPPPYDPNAPLSETPTHVIR